MKYFIRIVCSHYAVESCRDKNYYKVFLLFFLAFSYTISSNLKYVSNYGESIIFITGEELKTDECEELKMLSVNC